MFARACSWILLLAALAAAPARANHESEIGYQLNMGGSGGEVDASVVYDDSADFDHYVDEPLLVVPAVNLRSEPISFHATATATRDGHYLNPYGTSSDTIPFYAEGFVDAWIEITAGTIRARIEANASASPASFTAVGPIGTTPVLFTNPYISGAVAQLSGGSCTDQITFDVAGLPVGDPIQVKVVFDHHASIATVPGGGFPTKAVSRVEIAAERIFHAGSHSSYASPGIDHYLQESEENGVIVQNDPDSVEFTLDLANGDTVQFYQGSSFYAEAHANADEAFSSALLDASSTAQLRFEPITPGLSVTSALGGTYPVPEPPGGPAIATAALAVLARGWPRKRARVR